MNYTVLIERASSVLGTNIQGAATALEQKASQMIIEAWIPAGGVTVIATPFSKEVLLIQAFWRESESAS